MDVESFKGRFWLSVIDKLLLGLVVVAGGALVSYCVQSRQQQENLASQERIAVSRVMTDVLSDQRSALMVSVSGLMELVNHLISTGAARDENAVRLAKLEREIHGAIAILKMIHLARKKSTCEPKDAAVLEKFDDLITDELALPLLQGKMKTKKIQTKLVELLEAYKEVLEFTRCLAIDTIHHEVTPFKVKEKKTEGLLKSSHIFGPRVR